MITCLGKHCQIWASNSSKEKQKQLKRNALRKKNDNLFFNRLFQTLHSIQNDVSYFQF